jgi:UDPglucose 6-dehydrogenase
MRLTVFGLGYLGVTHAACMAELGHEVLGVEADPGRLAKLRLGELPFYEPGLPDLLGKHIRSGRLQVTDSYEEAADWSDCSFITVGTPPKSGEHSADLTQVETVIDRLVPLLTRDALIIGKSTVPVGTTQTLMRRANGLAKDNDVRVEIAWNPEFLREGHAIKDTLHPDRLVLGQRPSGRADLVVREIYAPLLAEGTPIIVTDPATAELVKVSANAFLATKISFINVIADVCSTAGADVRTVADAIGLDARIGRRFLNAGLGFGGGCLPKDIRAFMARASELGATEALSFLREVDIINMRRRTRMVDLTRTLCGGSVLGTRVAVLGAAFKPESDDVRDSPALNVAAQLQLQGGCVKVYDPKAMENARRSFPTLHYADSVMSACDGADVVLVLTEWEEFVDLDPYLLGNLVSRRTVIDGRLCLERAKWEGADWEYRS